MNPVAVKSGENLVEITLNPDFYPKPRVVLAVQDFSEACWVNLGESPNGRILVSLKPKSPGDDLSLLGFEFLNYLLSLVRAR